MGPKKLVSGLKQQIKQLYENEFNEHFQFESDDLVTDDEGNSYFVFEQSVQDFSVDPNIGALVDAINVIQHGKIRRLNFNE